MLGLRNLRFEVMGDYEACSLVQSSSDSYQEPGVVRMLGPQSKECHTQVPVFWDFTDKKTQMSNDVI